jgi:hypothetical protein
MRNYFIGKLSSINFRMATHEGDANRRLASEAYKILLLPESEVPSKYEKQFAELIQLIHLTIARLPEKGLIPIKLGRIQNRTAVKYIKLLYIIMEDMTD